MKQVTELRRALHFPLSVYIKDTTQQQPRGQDTRDEVAQGGRTCPRGARRAPPPSASMSSNQEAPEPIVEGFYGGSILGKVD